MMKTYGAVIGLAALVVAGSANASLLAGSAIYSSFTTSAPDTAAGVPGGPNSSYPVSLSHPGSPLLQEFHVSTPATLTSLDFRLSDNTVDSGSILVYLVADNGSGFPSNTGSSPFSTLTSKTLLGTILDSTLPSTATAGCTFGAGATINLCDTVLQVVDPITTSGNYWIALVSGADTANGGAAGTDSSAVWWRAGDNLGLNATGMNNAHVNGSGVLTEQTPGNITQSFELQVNTPEPASLALLGAGMTGLGLVRRRLSKKSAA